MLFVIRERNLLKKSGVDIDSIPRRTSNIFERFQESMKVILTYINIIRCMNDTVNTVGIQ